MQCLQDISVLKELSVEHGIPETLQTDNGLKLTNALFTEFIMEWKFDHHTSSPQDPWSNGQTKKAMETVKGLLRTRPILSPASVLQHAS